MPVTITLFPLISTYPVPFGSSIIFPLVSALNRVFPERFKLPDYSEKFWFTLLKAVRKVSPVAEFPSVPMSIVNLVILCSLRIY